MVGWNAYRDYDLFNLRPGEETHQFSSYDRANHNDDGFAGTYSCLRKEGSRCVIAEYSGPGEIASIWFTYEPDSVLPIGDIKITLDGKDVLFGQLQDIVNSGHSAPFTWPFVGNTNDTMGGNVIKVPMPFGKSMLVTTENNPHFYHVTYRRFPHDVVPKTFDPADKAQDVVSQFMAFGVQDPKAVNDSSGAHSGRHVSGNISGSTGTFTFSTGRCGIASQLSIRFPSIMAASLVEDDGRAFGKGGSSSFKLSLDEHNKQCQLTRRVDRTIGNQKVSVSVDGKKIGTLDSGAAVGGTWADQVLDIPASATSGKANINVKVDCLSSDLDCNEFFYALHCKSNDGSWKAPGYLPGLDWTLMDLLNVGWNNPHDETVHVRKHLPSTPCSITWFAEDTNFDRITKFPARHGRACANSPTTTPSTQTKHSLTCASPSPSTAKRPSQTYLSALSLVPVSPRVSLDLFCSPSIP